MNKPLSTPTFRFSILSFCTLFSCSNVLAQTTPSEFAELSLQELFSISTEEQSEAESGWSWTLQYRYVEYDGYLSGTDRLTIDEVLFVPGTEQRTASNFPVVPTTITQELKLLGLEYQKSPDWRFQITVPHVKQSTDHVSIVPNYDQFVIDSSGVGDITLKANYRLDNDDLRQWWLGFGVQVPTGSIDQEGDTPRAPGNQQLPYTMQLGSGTFDFPFDLVYQTNTTHSFSVSFGGVIRIGTNDRNYRLGNNYRASAKYNYLLNEDWSVSLAMDAIYRDKIKGGDQSLLVPQSIPYPASITNPNLYGGKKLVTRLGLKTNLSSDYTLSLELGKPLYQNLNGPQPKEKWQGALQLVATM